MKFKMLNFVELFRAAFGKPGWQFPADISKYEALRDQGFTPEQMYGVITSENMELFQSLDLMYRLYGLGSRQFKEIGLRYHGVANSLDEHLDNLAAQLEESLAIADEDERNSGAGLHD